MRIFQLILIHQLTISTTVALTSNNNNVQRNVNKPQQVIQMNRRNILFGLASVVPFVLNVPTTYAVEKREGPDSFGVDSYLYAAGYDDRAKQFNFATPDEIRSALEDNNTILLDVRSPGEIEANGRITKYDTTNKFVRTTCTPTECVDLAASPQTILGSDDKNVPIVIYCGSGLRANRARSVLLEHGYQGPILNAGAYTDIKVTLGV